MGKIRYYCEYCDRSFLDDLNARKRHLSGTQHNRLRKEYYLPYRDPREVYEEEKVKSPCRKFLTFNDCPFGDNCYFTHYSPPQLESLRLQVRESERQKSLSYTFQQALSKMPSEDSVKHWLNVWKSKKLAEVASPNKPAVNVVSQALLSWELPPVLESFYNLPLSLQPWKLRDIENVQLSDWG